MEFPARFEQRMRLLLGNEWQAFCAAFSAPLTTRGVRANLLKCTPAHLKERFPHPLYETPFSPAGFTVKSEFKAGSDPLHHAGAYYMQEPSAMSAVTVLAPKVGERVLDLCAAPGGKSTQIAASLAGQGLLWCNEYVPARARILAQNIERCGVRNAVVSCGDTALVAARLPAFFDGVLADVPCSGEGMFRKEPEALSHWSEENIALCAARGQEILKNAAACVKAGGRLVLSTCTFAPEENEWAVVRFLRDHPDFELLPVTVPFGRPAFEADRIASFGEEEELAFARTVPLSYCRRILPMDGGEGHFIALFHRRGEATSTVPPYRAPKETEAIKAARALYAECFTDTPNGTFAAFGDTVRLLPADLPATEGLNVLGAGIPVATIHSGRTLRAEPCHGAFQSAVAAQCRRLLSLSRDDPRLIAFLRGEEIAANGENGYTAVAVEGITVGFGKVSGGKLKNHYPKGLRLLK